MVTKKVTKEVVIKGISGKEAALEENFVISEGAMASVATNALMAATASNVTGKTHISRELVNK